MASNDIAVFDRALLRRRRDRAAATPGDHDFLFQETAERLMDRLEDVNRTFDTALEIGVRNGTLASMLRHAGKAGSIQACDLSEGFARTAAEKGVSAAVADEERLPFATDAFDLVVSNLALHWVNDLPGALIQIARVLKPDGLFQGVILGGETLNLLRACLMDAELEVSGGVSPRVSPMVDLRDAAGLLQRAGFALPVADLDRIEVSYPDAFRLMGDLRAMGETNAGLERLRVPTRRAVFLRAAQLYTERHAGPDGRIPARFDAIFLHGWRPAASQPKPLRPGSASARLADALGSEEKPAGDQVRSPMAGRKQENEE